MNYMFRDSIPGLEKIFKTDIVPPKIILITGPPGSMKTTFCYSIISKYLDTRDEFGLYTTLEETVDSHLTNIESLGVDLSLKMQISDLTDLREIDKATGEENMDYLSFLEKMIFHFKKLHGDKFTVFAIDSLGALYSLMEDTKNMRRKMFYFFKMIRDNNLITFVIMERDPDAPSQLLGNEGYLVDGIIMLGIEKTHGKLTRYIQIEKMRACEHSMEKFAIDVKKGGLIVLGPLFEK